MTDLPAWLAATATLSDDALAELGNKGLVRRAQKFDVSLLEATAKHVSVTCAGTDRIVVKLVPQGPQQAACPCQAAGVCVHVIAACLWARTMELPDEPPPAALAAPTSRAGARDAQADAAAAIERARETECETAQYAIEVVESLLGVGLSHLSRHSTDRLQGAAQRAKTGKLRTLSLLLDAAAGQASQLAADRDEVGEAQVLAALAQAWAAAHAIVSAPRDADLPANIRGLADTQTVDTGMLVPLGVRWWTNEAGARGYTAYWWDQDNGRVECLKNGRAKGTDPGFTKSWTAPLLLGYSLEIISNTGIRLEGAERDSSGQLKATTRTKIVDTTPLESIDVAVLARDIGRDAGLQTVGFGRSGARVEVIAVRKAAPELLLDEVNQELIWSVTDREKREHELRLPVAGTEQNAVTMLLATGQSIDAIAAVDGVPVAVWTSKPIRNQSLSLTRVAVQSVGSSARAQKKANAAVERVRAVRTDVHAVRRADEGRTEVEAWAARTREMVTGLAATGVGAGWTPSKRTRERIENLVRQAEGLGLMTAARQLQELSRGALDRAGSSVVGAGSVGARVAGSVSVPRSRVAGSTAPGSTAPAVILRVVFVAGRIGELARLSRPHGG